MSDKPTLITVDPTGLSTLQRELYLNKRPFIRHLIKFVTFLGIGALVHAWFLGPDFDPRSLWSWGYLLAWPIPMLIWLAIQIAVIGAWIFIVGVLLATAWFGTQLIVGHVDSRNKLRRLREREADLRFDPNQGKRP